MLPSPRVTLAVAFLRSSQSPINFKNKSNDRSLYKTSVECFVEREKRSRMQTNYISKRVSRSTPQWVRFGSRQSWTTGVSEEHASFTRVSE